MLEGWKCLECGVVYAPFVTECRCSATISTNEEQVGCFHDWPRPWAPCSKCGLVLGIPTWSAAEEPAPVPCQHIFPSESTTAGNRCTLCGVQEVLWENPNHTMMEKT